MVAIARLEHFYPVDRTEHALPIADRLGKLETRKVADREACALANLFDAKNDHAKFFNAFLAPGDT